MWAFMLGGKFGEQSQGQEQWPEQAVSHEVMPCAPAQPRQCALPQEKGGMA